MKPHIFVMGRRWYLQTGRGDHGFVLFGSVYREEVYESAAALWSTRKLFIAEKSK
jgi:hypothetical protein